MGGLTRLAASYPGRREGRGGALAILEAAAMAREKEAVAEARATLLRLRLDFSLAWMSKNNPHAGDMLGRVLKGLRRPGVPED
jgi:hypothetical protein